VFGQVFSYPKLNKSYKKVQEFVSPDWTLLDTISGDLNGDKIKDLVAILEYKDTISETRPNGFSIVTNPRVLLIFFKKSNGSLDLKLQHNTFLLRNGEDMRYEVYPTLSIKKGVLSIHYDLFHDYPTYKFRYQNNDFYIIGATVTGIHGGNWSEENINFDTRSFYKSSYYIDNEKNKKVKHLYLKDLQPLKLMDFKMPLTYKITEDYTL
jgi:hypothetical protein